MKKDIRQTGPETPIIGLNHRRPLTRRDFLARGLITGAATVAMPNLFSLFGGANPALAAPGDCGPVGGAGGIPYIGFDLAGGASMAGSNVLVGGPAGQLDFLNSSGYSKQGLPEAMIPIGDGTDPLVDQVVSDLGLRFHVDSPFYLGIKSKISDNTALGVNGCVICARSNNDTDTNPHNPIYGIARAGASGDLVQLIGSENSVSGGRSQAPMSMIDPSLRPTQVSRPGDSRGLVDTGKLVQLLSKQDAGAVMLASEMISELKLTEMSEQDATKQIIRCAYQDTTDLVVNFGSPDDLDPRLDDYIITDDPPIFTAADFDDTSFRKTASVMKLVVNRLAAAGTVQLSGYDYHDGTRATGEVRDFRAGQCMGACLEYAARVGTPLMLYVFTDGSLASNGQIDPDPLGRQKGIWQSDNSGVSSVFMLVYRPGLVRPVMTPQNVGNQIGYFERDGNVDTSSTRIADAVDLLAESIVLNYMALNGNAGSFETLFPTQNLGSGGELDQFIAFEPVV